jgi:hypothetical protein
MKKVIYESLLAKKTKGQRSFVVLIDPDNVNAAKLDELTALAVGAGWIICCWGESCDLQSS